MKSWNQLPLSDNLEFAMYGGKKDNTYYGGLIDDCNIPKVEKGYYYFVDLYSKNHTDIKDIHDDSYIMSNDRYSHDFILAKYDTENNHLYYLEYYS